LNDNGFVEKGAAVWIFDANFDGRIDMAEHVINGKVKRIKPSNGRIDTKMLSRNRMLRMGEPFDTLFDKIARDISGALN
jgi:hypothetical protein